MTDQAQSLRQLVSAERERPTHFAKKTARIITVTSGKGGVGKSNFTLNFALALKSLGRKVLVFDADIGMANIDVLMGVSSKVNLYHLLRKEKNIEEVIQYGPDKLPFIAGGSGIADMFTLSEEEINDFISQIERISDEMDYILFDTGAGLSKESMKFITSADQCLVVTTPEPTSLTDAYALIKVVHSRNPAVPFTLVVNRAGDEYEAAQASDKLVMTAHRFLEKEIQLLGFVRDDHHVVKSVKYQTPFYLAYPKCEAARDIQRLALRFLSVPTAPDRASLQGIKRFMQRWLKKT